MKYNITYSCGHNGTVKLFGVSSERERKIKYFENRGLCPECYKEKMKQEEKEKGLQFHMEVLPYIDETNGSLLLSIWFEGDTQPVIDDIKALGGYQWGRRNCVDLLENRKRSFYWNKVIQMNELKEEMTKATSIGADTTIAEGGFFPEIHYQIALKKQKEWEKSHENRSSDEESSLLEKIKGHRWNKKIYGKAGNYAIYLDGERFPISDYEKKELEGCERGGGL